MRSDVCLLSGLGLEMRSDVFLANDRDKRIDVCLVSGLARTCDVESRIGRWMTLDGHVASDPWICPGVHLVFQACGCDRRC
jgi:hypothetical protein